MVYVCVGRCSGCSWIALIVGSGAVIHCGLPILYDLPALLLCDTHDQWGGDLGPLDRRENDSAYPAASPSLGWH